MLFHWLHYLNYIGIQLRINQLPMQLYIFLRLTSGIFSSFENLSFLKHSSKNSAMSRLYFQDQVQTAYTLATCIFPNYSAGIKPTFYLCLSYRWYDVIDRFRYLKKIMVSKQLYFILPPIIICLKNIGQVTFLFGQFFSL